MAKNKDTHGKPANWGKLGGSGHMTGFKGVGTQAPGGTAVAGSGGGRRSMEPQAGPSGVMGFSKNEARNSFGAGLQEPGGSAVSGKREEGFARGGKHSMFGNRGSRHAKPGTTSAE